MSYEPKRWIAKRTQRTRRATVFELAGRPDLAAFFNEHIVDIVQHRDRYKALGIDFPFGGRLARPTGLRQDLCG